MKIEDCLDSILYRKSIQMREKGINKSVALLPNRYFIEFIRILSDRMLNPFDKSPNSTYYGFKIIRADVDDIIFLKEIENED